MYDKKLWPADVGHVVLVEDSLYFGDLHTKIIMHAQKIVLHRASMRKYFDKIASGGVKAAYLEYREVVKPEALYQYLVNNGADDLVFFDPTDYLLERRIRRYCDQYKLRYQFLSSPNFLTDVDQGLEFLNKHGIKLRMADFYIWQRKRLGILLEDNCKPVGGKWSFDFENRKKMPKEVAESIKKKDLKTVDDHNEAKYILEARSYQRQYFADAYGSSDDFYYPISREGALAWFEEFMEHRLAKFGPYEDAIVQGQARLFHSAITPVLNIGLVNPDELLDAVLTKYERGEVALASAEGFIRQIIGWREFVRLVYVKDGTFERKRNALEHTRPMPKTFWSGESGLLPFDKTVHKVLKYGYCHHIERLMVLGNLMLLCEITPDEVYAWFMSMFVDSYDWVMVPNVYGMSQYADGGLFATKPYLCGSNYLLKMSDYTKGAWCDIWDGLYWRFVDRNRELLRKNQRMSLAVVAFDKMSQARKKLLLEKAAKFLGGLRQYE